MGDFFRIRNVGAPFTWHSAPIMVWVVAVARARSGFSDGGKLGPPKIERTVETDGGPWKL